jgi:hypothetical protein
MLNPSSAEIFPLPWTHVSNSKFHHLCQVVEAGSALTEDNRLISERKGVEQDFQSVPCSSEVAFDIEVLDIEIETVTRVQGVIGESVG